MIRRASSRLRSQCGSRHSSRKRPPTPRRRAASGDPGVEAFDRAVLHRLAGIDEEQLDAVLICPVLEIAAGELWAIIDDEDIGIAALAGDVVEHQGDAAPGQRKIDEDRRAFAVQSSFRLAVRNLRPLASVSSVKSIDHRWLAAIGHQWPDIVPAPRFCR